MALTVGETVTYDGEKHEVMFVGQKQVQLRNIRTNQPIAAFIGNLEGYDIDEDEGEVDDHDYYGDEMDDDYDEGDW